MAWNTEGVVLVLLFVGRKKIFSIFNQRRQSTLRANER